MNFFKNIPASMNGLLVVMGVMAPLLMLGAISNPKMIVVWTSLYIVIGAIGGMGVLFFERSKKTKADGFARSVETNAASAEGLKDPQKIAQMANLRKEFQRGIDIYKTNGKNLYSLPWYVVVGEAGSGKTEMLRRSEIGFPDKLQDRWQGAGGTLSMNWWFTNRAVILDTAGRLFANEGNGGDQKQWTNFLQMLKANRPDCPINGLILVIPSERLLTHPDPELEHKGLGELDENAGQIAKQMETLQVELGIRFPVYIIVTKMDRVNGFREFFGKIDKPEDRYQILGWSNPAPLGTPFNPQSVTEYIHSVADRLKRRMMSELRDVEPEDVNGLRIDEVDGLYAFPSSFESMNSKLSRYLQHVFVTDEWSAKPPFLRGIYFTSSLQQGKVLDEALAAAMGVPFRGMAGEQQDDGLSLSTNRTYFVRDLFLDKIFSEKGLVTTAGKIRPNISGWKLWVPAFVLLLLSLFGILGYWAMNKNDEAKKWTALWTSDSGRRDSRIPPLATYENKELRAAKTKEVAKLLNSLDTLGQDMKGKPKFGWVFAPAQLLDRDLSENRRSLYSDLTAETLHHLEQAILSKLAAEVGDSSAPADQLHPEDWEVLHALVILQNAGTWDAAKKTVSIPDEPEAAWPAAKLLKTLFAYAGITNEKKQDFAATFEKSVWQAANIPDAAFQKRVTALHDSALRDIIRKLLPVEQLEQQKKSITDINEFHRSLLQIKGYNASAIDKLAATADQINQATQQQPGSDMVDSKHLANDRDTLLAVILGHAALAEKFGYDDFTKGDLLTTGAKALQCQEGALFKLVTETLDLVRSNPKISLNARNIEAFSSATPPLPASAGEDPDAEVMKKESQKITTILTDLKKNWFEKEFYRNQFKRYLKLPVASDADVGSNDDLLTLWKICVLAEKWRVDGNKIPQLIATFNCFFDVSKITSTDIIGTLRPCQMNFVKRESMSVARYSIKADGAPIAEFNLMESELKPANVRLDQALTFLKDGTPDGTVQSWGLVKDIKVGRQNPWRYTSLSGISYDISIPGTNLNALANWLTTKDFITQP